MEAHNRIALVGVIIAALALLLNYYQWTSKKKEDERLGWEEKTAISQVQTPQIIVPQIIIQQVTSPTPKGSPFQEEHQEQKVQIIATPPEPPSPTPLPQSPTLRPSFKYDIVVFVVNENNSINADLSSSIRDIVRKQGKSVAILSANIISSSNRFTRLFQGDGGEAQHSGILHYGRYTFLGKKHTSFIQQNSELENMITANVSLEIRIISSEDGNIVESLTLREKGPGFSQQDAENIAIARIVQELRQSVPALLHHL